MDLKKAFVGVLLVISLTFSLLPKVTPISAQESKISISFTKEQLSSSNYLNVIVELQDEPVIPYQLKKEGEASLLSIKISEGSGSYEKILTEKQLSLYAEIKKIAPDAKIGYRYQFTYNGFALKVRGSDIEKISKLKGVKKIFPSKTYQISDDVSNSVIGANSMWQMKDAKGNLVDGSGMVIAIIDTGVDYKHPDLGGGFGPNYKVIGGYDFGDKDTDPMDIEGHGTHVAGIAAADGKVKGVAPKAKILAYKIVSGESGNASTENIIAAIERAVKDGASAANLSFGSGSLGTSDPEDPENKAFDNAADAGVLSSVSAGNSGARCQTKPYPLGSPSAARKVISVAASDDGVHPAITIANPEVPESQKTILGNYADLSPKFPKDTDFEVVACGYGRPSDFEGIDVKGKIALVSRGPIGPNALYFRDKDLNAKEAGAVGIIIYNNMPGIVSPTFKVSEGDEKKDYIPAIFITQSEGLLLKDLINKGLKIRFSEVSNLGVVANFTSMGPASDFYFKPELSAPGVAIYSTIPNGEYASWQGTSMAAPHVAGAIALFKQIHPDWKSEDIKAAFMNTATILKNYQNGETFTWTLQGAGRINIPEAVTTPAIVQPYDLLTKVSNLKPFTFTIKNVSDKSLTFNISSEITLGGSDGIEVKFNNNKLTVDKGQSKTFTVNFVVDGGKLSQGPHEGIIWIDSGDKKLHVPFIVWNGDVEVPEKLYDVKASSNVIMPGNAQNNSIDFEFTLGSGSLIPPAEPNERPESSNIIDEIQIRITDLKDNTLGVVYAKSLLFLGHYKFSWDGRDIYGNYFLAEGKYKWVVAAVESNNDQQNPVIQDAAKVEGEFEVKNAPKTKVSIVVAKDTVTQEEVSTVSVKLDTPEKVVGFKGIVFFNANLLKVESVSLGDIVKQENLDKFSYKIDNLTGEIFVDIVAKEGYKITGNGNLLNFSIKGRVSGTSTLGFKESMLVGEDKKDIASVFFPSYITVNKAENPWDLNRDKKVDSEDLKVFSAAFGTEPKDPNYIPLADFNMDGIIDGKDLIVIASHFGESYP
ncbi:MAG: S8 family serine peptidase [Caldisericaceae bacterium]